jgi:hypothetical protein
MWKEATMVLIRDTMSPLARRNEEILDKYGSGQPLDGFSVLVSLHILARYLIDTSDKKEVNRMKPI